MKIKYLMLSLFALCSFFFLLACENLKKEHWPTSNWRFSKPENQGMDSKKLKEMNQYVKENLPRLSSIVVVRNGYIVFENAYIGQASDLRKLYGVTTSVMSTLIGIALKEGYIKSIDQKLIDYFPEYVNEKVAPDVNTITLRHLLTLTDGIAITDGEDSFSNITLTRALRAKPGTEFFYNNMSPQILSIIITKTTGLTALDFGKIYLFTPLGISKIEWQKLGGFNSGGYGMLLTSRDMAKIGHLYLKKGYWDGKQILPSEWVTESTSAQIKLPKVLNFSEEFSYGFLWWIHRMSEHEAFSSIGYGGQYISVVPDANIVVALTTDESSHYNAPKYLSLINNYVLTSIKK